MQPLGYNMTNFSHVARGTVSFPFEAPAFTKEQDQKLQMQRI
jgi:hypothetical protein